MLNQHQICVRISKDNSQKLLLFVYFILEKKRNKLQHFHSNKAKYFSADTFSGSFICIYHKKKHGILII